MVRLLSKAGYIGAKTERLLVVEWHGLALEGLTGDYVTAERKELMRGLLLIYPGNNKTGDAQIPGATSPGKLFFCVVASNYCGSSV
jgi:hypothetical protein